MKMLAYRDEEKPIYLYIHSDGGCIDAHFAIIDEIASLTKMGIEVNTICQGKACSAAAYILALGTEGCRYAYLNSCVMLHSASSYLGDDKIREHEGYLSYARKQEENILKLVAKACGKSSPNKYKEFSEKIKNTWWLTATEAKKNGIIDGIWTPEKEAHVNASSRITIEEST